MLAFGHAQNKRFLASYGLDVASFVILLPLSHPMSTVIVTCTLQSMQMLDTAEMEMPDICNNSF